jgi:Lrp/AsnC ligand binding domain
MERVWAYVFVGTENPDPKRVVREIRRLEGVIRADALLGTPDISAIVECGDIADMDAVIDRVGLRSYDVDCASSPSTRARSAWG